MECRTLQVREASSACSAKAGCLHVIKLCKRMWPAPDPGTTAAGLHKPPSQPSNPPWLQLWDLSPFQPPAPAGSDVAGVFFMMTGQRRAAAAQQAQSLAGMRLRRKTCALVAQPITHPAAGNR